MFALRAMKDDALAPLNCAITMRPLLGPKVSNNKHIKAFLGRFEQNRNNEHEASHFYNFVGPSTRIHRFSVPSEGVPLLEHLRIRHNDFIE
ncbi:hypothetical protein CFP56_020065 [Quercus suber]|uniref:Uncharacterized protein n=1 Tax=Quercus suber TaxID=58331 RepID=A0AAW0KH80_QUESU